MPPTSNTDDAMRECIAVYPDCGKILHRDAGETHYDFVDANGTHWDAIFANDGGLEYFSQRSNP